MATSSFALSLLACGGGATTSSTTPVVTAPSTPTTGARLNSSSCYFNFFYTTPASALSAADPYFSALWHLSNTGQVAPVTGGLAALPGEDIRATQAWLSNKGEGVRLAVIDDAIDVTHPDLLPNVVAFTSKDYSGNGTAYYPLPCGVDDTHGTAVAGVIAARDNNGIGIAGVAPRTQLTAFNALATGLDTDISDALSREAQAISVYHNSWGSADNGLLHSADAKFLTAVAAGTQTGRGGKGSVYVFPAGNGGCIYQVGNSCVEENSNFDGYVNNPWVMTVCATDDQGEQPYYGERGANVLVCAPSSNYSDQNMVTSLSVQGGVRNDFGGTSAAAPMVSGVVAMMLTANPALTWRDVRLILAKTARKNNVADTRWSNASGLSYNDKYGFGVVDANLAVSTSKFWSSVGGTSSLKTCDLGIQNVNAVISDKAAGASPGPGTTVSQTANCAQQITRIEFVEVTFTATHGYTGDLRVELISPSGAVSELATPRVCTSVVTNPLTGLPEQKTVTCGEYTSWRFGTVRHLDEAASGTWRLKVTDELTGSSGVLNSWGIKFYGR